MFALVETSTIVPDLNADGTEASGVCLLGRVRLCGHDPAEPKEVLEASFRVPLDDDRGDLNRRVLSAAANAIRDTHKDAFDERGITFAPSPSDFYYTPLARG